MMERELIIKEVFARTIDLVRRECCLLSCESEQDCPSYSDSDGCFLKYFLEWYEEGIEMMNLDSITKDKIKDYFLHKIFFL